MNSPVSDDDATLQAGDLTASYKLTFRKQAEDWVAIGTVTATDMLARKPVWLIVGIGKLPGEAIDRLQRALEREAARLRSQPTANFHSAD
jgi:hypothetical protein